MWTCVACTFASNHASTSACSVCDTARTAIDARCSALSAASSRTSHPLAVAQAHPSPSVSVVSSGTSACAKCTLFFPQSAHRCPLCDHPRASSNQSLVQSTSLGRSSSSSSAHVDRLDQFDLVAYTDLCSRDEQDDRVCHIADGGNDGLDVSVEMQMRWAMSNVSSSARSETTNAWKNRHNGFSQQRPLEPAPTRFAQLTHDEGPRLVNVTALIRAAFVISHHANAGLTDAMRAKSKQSLRVSEVYLASAAVDHVAALPRVDRGWGCGFRNIMMICSALRRTPLLAQSLFAGELVAPESVPSLPSDSIGTSLPSIAAIRHAIELAWQAGFDEISAQQFGHTLETHSGSWIGTTECATLFRYFGIAASVHAFPVATLAKPAASAAGKPMQSSSLFSATSSSNFKAASKSSVDPSFIHHKLMAFVCAHFKATAAVEPGKQLCLSCVSHCKQTAHQRLVASSSSSSAASSVGKGSTAGWFRSIFENDEVAHWLAVASPADLAISSASSTAASKSSAGSKGSAFKVYGKALGAPLNSSESDASQSKLTSFFGGADSVAASVSAKRPFGLAASPPASVSVEIDDDDDDFQDPKRMRPVVYVKSAASSWPNISPAITGASRVCPSCGGPGTMGAQGASSASSLSSSSASSSSATASSAVLPLFLQHRGHSRTIIGVERLAATGEYNLLVLDPSTPCHQLRAALSVGLLGALRVSVHELGRRDYEIVRVRADAPMTPAQRARSRVIDAGEIQ